MRRIKYTFGLDFGTSKTAISFAQADTINPQVVDVAIHGSDDRIPTCVLHDKVRDRFHVGDIAEQEYLLARDPAERAAMTFFANFKPHIGRSAEHRETALRFLKEVRSAERLAEKIDLARGEGVVAAGCPVAWLTGGGAQALLAMLKDAGFPPAFAIPEPVGAAFHFLGTQLRAQGFHRDIVVFDWGAGTFDMTVLRADGWTSKDRKASARRFMAGGCSTTCSTNGSSTWRRRTPAVPISSGSPSAPSIAPCCSG